MIHLKKHNQEAVNEILERAKEVSRMYTVRPPGSGKSFIVAGVLDTCPEALCVYFTNSNELVEDFSKKILIPYNFRCVKATTYRHIPQPSDKYKWIFLDEIHSAGADQVTDKLKAFLDGCPNATILGLSADAIRHLDKSRNMGIELCNSHLVAPLFYDDAMNDGIIETPTYVHCKMYVDDIKSVYQCDFSLSKVPDVQENRIPSQKEKVAWALEHPMYAEGISTVFRESGLDPVGKYIVFVRNEQHMSQIISISAKWFQYTNYPVLMFYETCKRKTIGSDYDAFLACDKKALRLFFCIGKYTHGVHPCLSGVILLRRTVSQNLFLQMIGRILDKQKSRSEQKPHIFDLVDNLSVFQKKSKDIEDLFSDIEENRIISSTASSSDKLYILKGNYIIYADDDEIFYNEIILGKLGNALNPFIGWDTYYDLAKAYYNTYKDLDVPRDYCKHQLSLGWWIYSLRTLYHSPSSAWKLTPLQIQSLEAIGMNWDLPDDNWDTMFNKAQAFYQEYGHLNLNKEQEATWQLSDWLKKQSQLLQESPCPLSKERIQLLKTLPLPQTPSKGSWFVYYEKVKEFLGDYGYPQIPYANDHSGLYQWWQRQGRILQGKEKGDLTEEQSSLLLDLHADWEISSHFLDLLTLYRKLHSDEKEAMDHETRKLLGHKVNRWISRLRKKKADGKLSQAESMLLEKYGVPLVADSPGNSSEGSEA